MTQRTATGFTLIEITVAIAVVGLLSLVLSALLVTAQRSAATEQARADLISENRLLMDTTIGDIQEASDVLSNATVLGTSYTTGAQTLILALPAIDANQNLLTGVSDLLVFQKNGTSYVFSQQAGVGSARRDTTSRVFSARVSGLTFTYFDASGNQLSGNYQNAKSVAVNATVAQTVRGRTIGSTLTDTATLRNK